MKVPALLFVIITGCCAKENLHGASFLFSKSSETASVVLKPTVTVPLSNMTVCLQYYTDLVQRDSLFKLVDKSSKRTLFHLFHVSDYYYISIGQDLVYYKTDKESMELKLICVSWDLSTGVIHFILNGLLFPRKVLKPGFLIGVNATAVLGQSLSTAGIGYDRGLSYVGEITNVHMWDYPLHPSEMRSLYFNNCYNCNGNVISWESVDYEVHGDVFLYKPSIKP